MKICDKGLNLVQVMDGDGTCALCCWMKAKIGKLCEKSFSEIYHGEIAEKYRNKLINSDFSSCPFDGCPYRANGNLEDIMVDVESIPEYPNELWLAYEGKCNYHCTVCSAWENMDRARKEDLNKNYDVIENRIREVMPHVKKISANGRAELFCSDRTLKLLSEWRPLAPAEECSVTLETNGSLFNSQNWKKIENLGKYRLNVAVTVMSFNEKNYQYLSGTKLPISNIIANLHFMHELREQNIINYLEIATVVQERNFREMPEFAERCINEFGADRVRLRPFFASGAQNRNIEWFADVRNPYHPYHDEYIDVLKDERLNHPNVYKWSGDLKSGLGEHPGIKNDLLLNNVDKLLRIESVSDLINRIIETEGGKTISIYGAGRIGKTILRLLSNNTNVISEVYDKKYNGYRFSGICVIDPKKALNKKEDNIVLITATNDAEQIKTSLEMQGWKGKIICLDDFFRMANCGCK